ncbi:MAG: PAS domain S-box protein [Magnetococcales bacterium]|nr:PAS domain S-box protein [Magnetococcales bacterium]
MRETLGYLLKSPFLRTVLLASLGLTAAIAGHERFVVYPAFQNEVVAQAEEDARRVARHLEPQLLKGGRELQAVNLPEEFVRELPRVMQDFAVAKVKVFTSRGEVIHSSEAPEIGSVNKNDYFYAIVAKGKLFSKLVQKQATTMEGATSAADVVEIYVPVMTEGRFTGAFELYYDVTERMERMRSLLERYGWILLGLASGMSLVMLGVVYNAAGQVREREHMQRRLQTSEARFRSMADVAQDAMIVIDGEGRITFWNRAAERIFGFGEAEVMGRGMHDLLAPERFHDAIAEGMRQFRESGQGNIINRTVELVARRKNGEEFPFSASTSAMRVEGEWWAVALLRDVTARKSMEERLRLGSSVMEHALDGIMVTDAQGVIRMINPAFTQVTGFTIEEVVGRKPNVLRSGRHNDQFYADMWKQLRQEGAWRGEVWNRRKDGSIYPEWLSISAIRDEYQKISHFVGIFIDITQRKVAEQNLERLAFYDALTGIPNRMYFMERLKQGLADARRNQQNLAIFFLDLDLFKQVNDTHGHEVGDLLLQEVATRLKGVLREQDTAARLGGDEFALILKTIHGAEDAEKVATKVVGALTEPFQLAGRECRIGTSIGISLYPDHGVEGEALVGLADFAMYRAKKGGRNRWVMHEPEISPPPTSG